MTIILNHPNPHPPQTNSNELVIPPTRLAQVIHAEGKTAGCLVLTLGGRHYQLSLADNSEVFAWRERIERLRMDSSLSGTGRVPEWSRPAGASASSLAFRQSRSPPPPNEYATQALTTAMVTAELTRQPVGGFAASDVRGLLQQLQEADNLDRGERVKLGMAATEVIEQLRADEPELRRSLPAGAAPLVKKELAMLQRHRQSLQAQLRQVQVSIDAYHRLLARSTALDQRALERALLECERLVADGPSASPLLTSDQEASLKEPSIRSAASTDSELPVNLSNHSFLVPLAGAGNGHRGSPGASPLATGSVKSGSVRGDAESASLANESPSPSRDSPEADMLSREEIMESSDGLRELRRMGHRRNHSVSSIASTSSSRLIRVAEEDRRSFQTPELAKATPGDTLRALFEYRTTDVRSACSVEALCCPC